MINQPRRPWRVERFNGERWRSIGNGRFATAQAAFNSVANASRYWDMRVIDATGHIAFLLLASEE